MASVVHKFLGHVLPGVIRPLRVLWNEVIGFLFLALAAYAVPSVIRNIRQLQTPDGSPFRVGLSVFFAAIMGFFGVTSFLRARKISRS